MTDEVLVVRDHARPCEHGSLWPHVVTVKNAKWWQEPECLGGREIVLKRLENGLLQQVDQVPQKLSDF